MKRFLPGVSWMAVGLRGQPKTSTSHQAFLAALEQGDRPSRGFSILLWGGCIAEALARGALPDWQVEHVLYQSGLHERPQIPAGKSYDALILALSLRTVMGQAAQRLLGFHDADRLALRSLPAEESLPIAKEILRELLQNVIEGVDGRFPVLLPSFVEPPPSETGLFQARSPQSLYRMARDLNDHLSVTATGQNGVFYLETNDLLRRHGDLRIYDGYDLCFAHAGLRHTKKTAFYSALFARIEAMLEALGADRQQPIKAIITDLDNTLWKGVLAEMDELVPGDHTEGWPIGYAEALLICKQRGILLAICSKNDDAQTRINFDKVWYGRLRLDDFASIRINWRPKSENIREILAELNILPEHALFIDDNPLEIAEVQRAFPQMRTLSGDPHRWRMELIYGVPTQVPRLSEEAAQRTEWLQAKVQREQMAATASDREGYLRDLQLRAEIRSIHADDKAFDRAVELINRTNQFNTTGRRWSAAELRRFDGDGGRLWILRAADRFAEHGIVSVALIQSGRLRQMVLSCRVFGLGLEDAFLAQMVAKNPPPEPLRADWQDTGRNATARQFLERHFAPEEGGEGWVLHMLPEWPEHIGALA